MKWLSIVLACALGAGQPAGNTWLVFVDDLHLDFVNTGRLRDLIKRVGNDLIQQGDTYAFRTSGPLQIEIGWTRDHSVLHSAAGKVSGSGLKASDIIADPDGGRRELRYRADIALTSASELVNAVNALHGRTASLIYISNGYYLDDETTRVQLHALTQAARASEVRIFAIDPRVLNGAATGELGMGPGAWRAHLSETQEGLRFLARETGGRAFVDPDDAASVLKTIARF